MQIRERERQRSPTNNMNSINMNNLRSVNSMSNLNINNINRNGISVVRSQSPPIPMPQSQISQQYATYGQPIQYVPINNSLSPSSAYQLPQPMVQRK